MKTIIYLPKKFMNCTNMHLLSWKSTKIQNIIFSQRPRPNWFKFL